MFLQNNLINPIPKQIFRVSGAVKIFTVGKSPTWSSLEVTVMLIRNVRLCNLLQLNLSLRGVNLRSPFLEKLLQTFLRTQQWSCKVLRRFVLFFRNPWGPVSPEVYNYDEDLKSSYFRRKTPVDPSRYTWMPSDDESVRMEKPKPIIENHYQPHPTPLPPPIIASHTLPV